jgi:UDP-N-acetylglucosamine/UDP-N-acetylgalactosamine diphosphorylase
MTSRATDAATRALFAQEGCFGVPAADVRFFRQPSLPVLDARGRLLLAAPDRLAEAPCGHGSVMPALVAEGVLDEMEARGVEALFHYQVDNPLLPVGDPVLLGVQRLRRAEMTSKVVRRRSPDERMGTVVRAGGRLRVVEYSEIREPLRSARDAAGGLRFWAGSIGAHVYAPRLARRVAADAARALPFHAARKRVRALDPEGGDATPRRRDALKLERFVFDALPHARPAALVEARREEEYAPVKRPEGAESPESARRALVALYRRWLEQAGVDAPPAGIMFEIDHARIPGPEALRALGLQAWQEAGDAIAVATTPDHGARG